MDLVELKISQEIYERPISLTPFPRPGHLRAEHKAGKDAARLQVVQSCRAVLAFSRVGLKEAASEPGICVAEYSLVISRWRLPLWSRGDRQHSKVMLWVT
ncbi:MAG: hypothetical protein HY694_02420 [Deltaproteobacteria bacterium]|nr:hypothetical protein [Deltaproteobacteria bacterium]